MPIARQIVYPFTTLHRALSGCALEPDLPPDATHGADRWITSIEDVASGFAFRARFGNDWNGATRDTEYTPRDLDLVVRHRDDANKRATELQRWPLHEIPETCSFQGVTTGVDFAIHISLVATRTFTPRNRPEVFAGTVVANRAFTFNRSGATFPVRFANFQDEGWPGNAIYQIEIVDDNFELPAAECVVVHINEKLRNLYEGRDAARSPQNRVATQLIGASVFSEVARQAITSDWWSNDSRQGLGGALIRSLCGNDPGAIGDWQRLASEDPGSFAQRVADRLRLADALGSVR